MAVRKLPAERDFIDSVSGRRCARSGPIGVGNKFSRPSPAFGKSAY